MCLYHNAFTSSCIDSRMNAGEQAWIESVSWSILVGKYVDKILQVFKQALLKVDNPNHRIMWTVIEFLDVGSFACINF